MQEVWSKSPAPGLAFLAMGTDKETNSLQRKNLHEVTWRSHASINIPGEAKCLDVSAQHDHVLQVFHAHKHISKKLVRVEDRGGEFIDLKGIRKIRLFGILFPYRTDFLIDSES